ncbi:M23 family metallopeptidase [Bacteroides fragilis]|nr:M23 family metallopeptidase [Bacteroides fragilis]
MDTEDASLYAIPTALRRCTLTWPRITPPKVKKVDRGAVIAFAGSTGKSTGYHLHYEIRKNGKPIKPYWYGYDD